MIDHRISVPLALEDGRVAMTLVLAHGLCFVPGEDEGKRLVRVDTELGVAKREVERRARRRPLAPPRLEAAPLRLPARLAHDLEIVREVGVRRVAAEVRSGCGCSSEAGGLSVLAPLFPKNVTDFPHRGLRTHCLQHGLDQVASTPGRLHQSR